MAEVKTTELTVDGYTFKANLDAIDNVETLEIVEEIQEGKATRIIELVKLCVGEDGYKDMKAYFVKKDGQFRFSKLNKIIEKIFEKFDPKG